MRKHKYASVTDSGEESKIVARNIAHLLDLGWEIVSVAETKYAVHYILAEPEQKKDVGNGLDTCESCGGIIDLISVPTMVGEGLFGRKIVEELVLRGCTKCKRPL